MWKKLSVDKIEATLIGKNKSKIVYLKEQQFLSLFLLFSCSAFFPFFSFINYLLIFHDIVQVWDTQIVL